MAREKSGTLVVRNLAQRVLFEEELKGQLSDGHWENSLPSDHWEQWCAADVVVAKAGEPVGRDFHVRRESYGFTRRELLDVVAYRMLHYVRVALSIGYPLVDPTEASFSSVVDYAMVGGVLPPYAGDIELSVIASVGRDRIRHAAHDDDVYTYDDMLKDLADLQRIIKVRRDEYVPEPALAAMPREFLVRVNVPLVVRVPGDNPRQAEGIAVDWYLEQDIARRVRDAVEETPFYGPGGENGYDTTWEAVPE